MPLDSLRSPGTKAEAETTAASSRERTDPGLRSRRRVIVERVWPEIDGGRFPIKRGVGEPVTVSADIFADGHDLLAGGVKYRHPPGPQGPRLPDPPGPAVGRGL